MIRKFSVTNANSNQSAGSASVSITPTGSTVASPTLQQKTGSSDGGKKLYAQSLESTENSVTNSHVECLQLSLDHLLYPISSEQGISTDEGLSMSEVEDGFVPKHTQLNKILTEVDIDLKLKSTSQRGETKLVKELLDNGAQVVMDETGSTAMHVAAQNGFAEVVRLLLEHGTDVDLPDSNGYTALHKASSQGHLDVLELLINEGCDIDTQDELYGNTPLHEAAWHGYSKSVDLLLKNKSNAFITNRAGCTPLHLSAQNGHNQSGRTLLYGGCSPDVKNNYGDTPLHTAARYGHAGIARILISARCSVGEQNKNGDTALHITAAFKRRKIAKLSVEAGIDALVRNKQEETAIDIATRKGHVEIIDIIYQTSRPMHPSSHLMEEKSSKTPRHPDEDLDLNKEKEAKKKSHNVFVSWIKKKFSKKSSQTRECKSPTREHLMVKDNETAAYLNSQYIKKPGFAYYRDLAGNIRQGPCGYVPACHCEPGSAPKQNAPPISNEKINCANIKQSQSHINDRMREPKAVSRRHRQHRANERTLDDIEEPDNGYSRETCTETDKVKINKQLAQVEEDLQQLRGDLDTWLTLQTENEGIAKPEENPFAYAIGQSQTRFGDDFDHERMARYDVTDQFPPPPRLFRSRSDETLSHSEYSYHGRAYKSREAAMEEIKTLRHHGELRARRRRMRAASDGPNHNTFRTDVDSRRMQSKLHGHTAELKSSTQNSVINQNPQLIHQHSAKPNLWQSKENIRQKDLSADKDTDRKYGPVYSKAEKVASSEQQINQNSVLSNNRNKGKCELQSTNTCAKVVTDNSQVPDTSNNVAFLPASQGTHGVFPNAFQPSTHRFISAVRNDPIGQNNQQSHSTTTSLPVGSQRPTQTLPSASNNDVREARQPVLASPNPRTLSQYQQHHMLYPESQQKLSHPSVKSRKQLVSKELNNDSSHEPLVSSTNIFCAAKKPQVPTSNHNASAHSSQVVNSTPCDLRQSAKISDMPTGNQATTAKDKLLITDFSVTQTGESCCGSSNPDSGYGGQTNDLYGSQSSPQQAIGIQSSLEYNRWYSKQLQDAARKINNYVGLLPQRPISTDV